jgi:hypothetical protein
MMVNDAPAIFNNIYPLVINIAMENGPVTDFFE